MTENELCEHLDADVAHVETSIRFWEGQVKEHGNNPLGVHAAHSLQTLLTARQGLQEARALFGT